MSDQGQEIEDLTRRADQHDRFRRRRKARVDRQILFMFFGGIAALVLVAVRGELNTNHINDSRYQACLVRLDTQTRFNNTREDVGRAIIALSPEAPQSDRDAMMQSMIDSKQLPLPIC